MGAKLKRGPSKKSHLSCSDMIRTCIKVVMAGLLFATAAQAEEAPDPLDVAATLIKDGYYDRAKEVLGEADIDVQPFDFKRLYTLLGVLSHHRGYPDVSNIYIENAISEHLKPVIAKLNEAGVKIEEDIDGIRVSCNKRPKAIDIKTLPYPGFPTDMQAQFMAMLTIADGTGLVTETVFENRFMHVDELKRMGACIKVDGRTSIVEGVPSLNGCQVKATDLRAGAAMVLAGLVANGETEVSYIHHIDRGYDNLVEKLCGLGADICRVEN